MATCELAASAMGTVVSVQVVGGTHADVAPRVRSALDWFTRVEETCSRFRRESELSRLSRRIGETVAVSPLLFHTLTFALAVAESSDGAFDPTVGAHMQARGHDRAWDSGERIARNSPEDTSVSWRDITLDDATNTVTLAKPMWLDLGALAKGLAVDLAVRELEAFDDFAVFAGGDLYVRGHNGNGDPWSVGVRHPHDGSQLLRTLSVSDRAVCTSGNYEWRARGHESDHILDLRAPDARAAGTSATEIATDRAPASVTVVAPTTMVADALATAAFVLGEHEAVAFLARHGVDGMLVTNDLRVFDTAGMAAYASSPSATPHNAQFAGASAGVAGVHAHQQAHQQAHQHAHQHAH
jgi:FAD:protein FMN transferase